MEWNDKAAALSGYTKEEVLGKPLVEMFIHSDYKQDVNAALQNACHGIETAELEFPLVNKDLLVYLQFSIFGEKTQGYYMIIYTYMYT